MIGRKVRLTVLREMEIEGVVLADGEIGLVIQTQPETATRKAQMPSKTVIGYMTATGITEDQVTPDTEWIGRAHAGNVRLLPVDES